MGCGYMFMLYFTASLSKGAQGGSEGANGLCSDDRRDTPLKSGLWHWSPCLLLPRAGITAGRTLINRARSAAQASGSQMLMSPLSTGHIVEMQMAGSFPRDLATCSEKLHFHQVPVLI